MAPVIMGNPERPELAEELANSFCRTDPAIARTAPAGDDLVSYPVAAGCEYPVIAAQPGGEHGELDGLL
jgi:hypothetical protein